MKFRDVEFMTAQEKERVLKAWERFLKGGCKPQQFTKALYDHLILHCSFIAHYSREGFYNYYFSNARVKKIFLSQFDPNGEKRSAEMGGTYWLGGDYDDLNNAMVEVAGKYIPGLIENLNTEERENDLEHARHLLQKHGIEPNF